MRRTLLKLTAAVGALSMAAVPAMAVTSAPAPSVCVVADVNINDEVVIDEELCLPPADEDPGEGGSRGLLGR